MALKQALGWSTAQSALRIGLGFFSAKLSAIYLGPAGMALVGQINNFMQVSVGAIANGASTGVISLTARHEADGDLALLWGTALRLVLGVACVTALIVMLGARQLSEWLLFSREYWPVLVAAGVVIVLGVIDNLLLAVLNGLKQVQVLAKASIISTVVEVGVFATLTYFFRLWGGLFGIVGIFASRIVVSSVVASRSGLVKRSSFVGVFDNATAKQIAHYYPMLIAQSIALPVAQILVRNRTIDAVGLEQSGLLQATWRLSDMYVAVLTTALGFYFMSHFAALSTDEERAALLRKTMLQMFVFTACAAASIFLLRDSIISVVLTERFLPMRELLLFQLAGDVLKMVDYPLQMALVSQRRTAWYIGQTIAGPAVYVAMVHVLLPTAGLQGAPIAYAISYLVLLIALLVAWRKVFVGVSR